MRPMHCPPRWTLTGDSGATATGPASSTLRSVIARLASLVRWTGLVYVGVQVAIWHSFYLPSPWRLAAPLAAMAWMATAAVHLLRRPPTALFACLDSAVLLALALVAADAIPPGVRDQAFSWLVISMTGQLIVTAWYAPAVLSVPLALAAPAAYLTGTALVGDAGRRATLSAAILLMVAGIHLLGRRQLYGRAAAADAALDQAGRKASEQYVVLSRNIDRREHERMMHDTILNTLTAIARAGTEDVAGVVRRCRQDVILLERALDDQEDPRPSTCLPAGDLVASVQAVAAELRARGLRVHVDITDDSMPALPAQVAAGISSAVREALANVAAHAGTGEAWVKVGRTAPGGVWAAVRDRGTGFDLAGVVSSRLGLRRSIVERTADCGGLASIRSEPGHGTEILMAWPASAEPDQSGLADLARTREHPQW